MMAAEGTPAVAPVAGFVEHRSNRPRRAQLPPLRRRRHLLLRHPPVGLRRRRLGRGRHRHRLRRRHRQRRGNPTSTSRSTPAVRARRRSTPIAPPPCSARPQGRLSPQSAGTRRRRTRSRRDRRSTRGGPPPRGRRGWRRGSAWRCAPLGPARHHVVPAADHEGGRGDPAQAVDGAPPGQHLEAPQHGVDAHHRRLERRCQRRRVGSMEVVRNDAG